MFQVEKSKRRRSAAQLRQEVSRPANRGHDPSQLSVNNIIMSLFLFTDITYSWVKAGPRAGSKLSLIPCPQQGSVTVRLQVQLHSLCNEWVTVHVSLPLCLHSVCGYCSHGFRQDSDQQSCSRETAWRFERIKSHVSIREPHWQQSRMLQPSPDIQPVSGSTQNSLSHRVHEPTATDCLIKLIWSACATFLALKYSMSVIL